jgi:hypothetical protein
MTADALNALVQATGDVDEQRENAQRYGITEQFDELDYKITDELDSKFGVSKDQAREWLAIQDGQEYTRALYNYIDENNVDGRPGAYDVNGSYEGDFYNPVIDGEESEFRDTMTAPVELQNSNDAGTGENGPEISGQEETDLDREIEGMETDL